MLVMAWLGRLLTNWAPQQDLREFGVRFSAMTLIGEKHHLHRAASSTSRSATASGRSKVEVTTVNAPAELKVVGDAWIALP